MLKVGQEVTIRKDLTLGKNYNCLCPTQKMVSNYRGKRTKILHKYSDVCYDLEIDKGEYTWTISMFEPITDNVNHPSHYQQGGKEAIEIIKDATGNNFVGFLVGNVIKYLTRFEFKNGVEDLKKAQFYLNRLIKEVEGK